MDSYFMIYIKLVTKWAPKNVTSFIGTRDLPIIFRKFMIINVNKKSTYLVPLKHELLKTFHVLFYKKKLEKTKNDLF